jgi:hypothetical protein
MSNTIVPTERKNLAKTRPVSVNEVRKNGEKQKYLTEKMQENDQFKKQNLNNPASILS